MRRRNISKLELMASKHLEIVDMDNFEMSTTYINPPPEYILSKGEMVYALGRFENSKLRAYFSSQVMDNLFHAPPPKSRSSLVVDSNLSLGRLLRGTKTKILLEELERRMSSKQGHAVAFPDKGHQNMQKIKLLNQIQNLVPASQNPAEED